jgi:hypothetical protein
MITKSPFLVELPVSSTTRYRYGYGAGTAVRVPYWRYPIRMDQNIRKSRLSGVRNFAHSFVSSYLILRRPSNLYSYVYSCTAVLTVHTQLYTGLQKLRLKTFLIYIR